MFILPIIPPYVMEQGTREALLTHELVPDVVPVFHWCTPVLVCFARPLTARAWFRGLWAASSSCQATSVALSRV